MIYILFPGIEALLLYSPPDFCFLSHNTPIASCGSLRSILDPHNSHIHPLSFFLSRRFDYRLPVGTWHRRFWLQFSAAFHRSDISIRIRSSTTRAALACTKIHGSRRMERYRSTCSVGLWPICLDTCFGEVDIVRLLWLDVWNSLLSRYCVWFPFQYYAGFWSESHSAFLAISFVQTYIQSWQPYVLLVASSGLCSLIRVLSGWSKGDSTNHRSSGGASRRTCPHL